MDDYGCDNSDFCMKLHNTEADLSNLILTHTGFIALDFPILTISDIA